MFEERYRVSQQNEWAGRIDSSDNYDAFRWHQWIKSLDLRRDNMQTDWKLGFAILGFCCDEGVRRNKGRQGAAQGPAGIRKELANLPCAFSPEVRLFDAGNIICEDGDLAASQDALAEAVFRIRDLGLFPVVLGGGHEVSLGHYHGHARFLPKRKTKAAVGIINFDAHFDLRPLQKEGSSGTMFRQIANEAGTSGNPFNYLCLGIQRSGNTVELFKTAEQLGVTCILASEVSEDKSRVIDKLDAFIDANDQIYLTVCADVFSSAIAPGVSAPQPCGLFGHEVIFHIRNIIAKNRTVGFDIAEVAPGLEQGNATASLAKAVIFSVVDEICALNGLAR